jgi:hypothetical protein
VRRQLGFDPWAIATIIVAAAGIGTAILLYLFPPGCHGAAGVDQTGCRRATLPVLTVLVTALVVRVMAVRWMAGRADRSDHS